MGKAGHIGIQILRHDSEYNLKQFKQKLIHLYYFISDIQSHIESHLVIAAPACVHLLARITYKFNKLSLDEAVYILIIMGELYSSLVNVILNCDQSLDNSILLLKRDNMLLLKHHNMGNTALYILFE